jgi:hypothetical protein
MATLRKDVFESKQRDAMAPRVPDKSIMIRSVMNRSDWAILIALALIWGGAFFFIGVAVHQVAPLTYVWVRLTVAAAAMWLFLWWRG